MEWPALLRAVESTAALDGQLGAGSLEFIAAMA